MKNRRIVKLSYYSIILGWFPFMWACAFASHSRVEVRLIVILVGFGLCLFGSIMLNKILNNDELFDSIDGLQKEKQRYKDACGRLETKIKNL